jgi:hypothetical protein
VVDVRFIKVFRTDVPDLKKELRVMKLHPVTTVLVSIFAAPLLATPMDAFTLYALLGAAALGFTIVSRAISRKPQFARLPAYARIHHGAFTS